MADTTPRWITISGSTPGPASPKLRAMQIFGKLGGIGANPPEILEIEAVVLLSKVQADGPEVAIYLPTLPGSIIKFNRRGGGVDWQLEAAADGSSAAVTTTVQGRMMLLCLFIRHPLLPGNLFALRLDATYSGIESRIESGIDSREFMLSNFTFGMAKADTPAELVLSGNFFIPQITETRPFSKVLEQEFVRRLGASNNDDYQRTLPRLLEFPQLTPRKPQLEFPPSYPDVGFGWRIRFVEQSDKRSAAAGGRQVYALVLDYHQNRWPVSEEDAVRLWPLGVALQTSEGRGGQPAEIELSLRPPGWIRSETGKLPEEQLYRMRVLWEPKATTIPKEATHTPLMAWNRRVAAPYLEALAQVKGGSPGSLVPSFWVGADGPGDEPQEQSWELRYLLADEQVHNSNVKPEHFRFQFREMIFTAKAVTVVAELRNFLAQDRSVPSGSTPLRLQLELGPSSGQSAPDALEDDEVQPRRAEIRLFVRDLGTAEAQIVRIGSLGLELGAVEMPKLDGQSQHVSATARHEVTACFRKQGSQPPRVQSVPLGPLSMAMDLSLGVASFGPGGQDRTAQETGGERPQDRRASKPLLIPLSDTSRSRSDSRRKEAPYHLVARESCESGSTQSLSLRIERAGKKQIQDAGSGAEETDLVVLDQQPLLIARVLCKLGLGESRELGNWSGEGAEGSHWELPNNAGSFKLILPPQGLGESILKNYDASRDPMAPYDELGNPRPLPYYLSPSAEITLARSAHEQNFSEVPWNLRRLLGHPEQPFPGAITQALSFELLYGLSAQLQAGNQMLLLAEIGARLGNLPEPLSELRGRESQQTPAGRARGVYSRYRQSTERIVSGAAGRLGMLQLWTPGLRQWEAEFVQGVSFRFRSTRRIAHPIYPGSYVRYDDDNVFDPNTGLQGGADWGFTQEGVHREVVQSGTSSSGRLSQLSFTALGGSGTQSAGFAKDKSFLQTQTALGRTFYYSIVRVGRIGMLWNPARHVIVYERTVMDSDQFKDKEDTKWRGLPVLRKVREYVEILQRERGYPDFGDPELTRGFVRGVAFASHIIPVDSAAWGYDIPGGSVIPLYKPGAGRSYPEPDVRLKLETAARSGDQVVSARITNPEILLFYTSTNRDDGANTDTWAPVAGVDYPAAPLPVSPDVRPVLPEDPDATLPDPTDCEPGYERFCLRVALEGRAVNLMAGRSAAAQEATLQTVSMVRRSLRRGGDSSGLGTEFSQKLQDLGPLLERAVGRTLTSLSQDAVDRLASELRSTENQVHTAWQTLIASCGEPMALLERTFRESQQAWTHALDACLESAARNRMTVQAVLRDLKALSGSAPNLLSEIGRRQTSLLAALKKRVDELAALAARLKEALAQALAEVVAAASSLPSRLQYARLMFRAIEELLALIRGTLAEFLESAESAALTWLSKGAAELVGRLLPERVLLSSAADPLTAAEASALAAAAAASELWTQLRGYLSPSSGTSPFRLWQALGASDEWKKMLALPVGALDHAINQWSGAASDAAMDLERLSADVRRAVATAAEQQLAFVRGQGTLYQKLGGELKDHVAKFVGGALSAAVASLSKMEAAAHAEALELCRQLGQNAAQLPVAVGRRYSERLGVPDGLGDRVLRLAFAHGTAPVADALKLNRERLTYYFHEAAGDLGWAEKLGISFTPATALVNRVGTELEQLALKSLSARLPTAELVQEFLPLDPGRLLKFDPQGILTQLRSLLPDFAGLNLASLLGDLKLPDLNSKNVRVTTGFNRAKRQPFVDILINVKLAESVSLLDMAGLTLRLEGAELHAHAHVTIDQSGAQKQEVEASISATWSLRFGGEPLLTLSEAELRFSEGRVAFRVSPGKIQLNAALQFITDLLQKLQPSGDSGLALELVPGPGSLPIGARARLDVALPALQSGAFSISNIALGVLFELAVAESDGFYIKTGLSLSSKERPFNLSVLCLGGGGWVSLALGYRPLAAADKLSLSFSVGITAGACLPFDIGVASGAVYILLYLEVEYSLPQSSGGLSLALGLLLGGEVNILSILSISVSLRLEARYQAGVVTGSGRLKVKIKICAFFKISVDKSFTLKLAGKSSARLEGFRSLRIGSDPAAAPLGDLIGAYLDTFGDWNVA